MFKLYSDTQWWRALCTGEFIENDNQYIVCFCKQPDCSPVRILSLESIGLKVSVKENEVPTEKNSSRASIFATKTSYISN